MRNPGGALSILWMDSPPSPSSILGFSKVSIFSLIIFIFCNYIKYIVCLNIYTLNYAGVALGISSINFYFLSFCFLLFLGFFIFLFFYFSFFPCLASYNSHPYFVLVNL